MPVAPSYESIRNPACRLSPGQTVYVRPLRCHGVVRDLRALVTPGGRALDQVFAQVEVPVNNDQVTQYQFRPNELLSQRQLRRAMLRRHPLMILGLVAAGLLAWWLL